MSKGTSPKPVLTGYKVENVRSADIHSEAFQRPINLGRCRAMADAWDWSLFRPLTIARLGSRDMLVDGQHTHGSMTAMSFAEQTLRSIDLNAIPARIIVVKSMEEAAALYVYLNTERKALTQWDIFKGECAMKLPVALRVMDAASKWGLKVGPTQGIDIVAAVSTAKSLADAKPKSLIDPTLEYIVRAWPVAPGPHDPAIAARTEGMFLAGVAKYIVRVQGVTGAAVDVSKDVATLKKRRISLGNGVARFEQPVTPKALQALANQMVTDHLASGGNLSFGKDMATWVGDALGRTIHTKTVWRSRFGGR